MRKTGSKWTASLLERLATLKMRYYLEIFPNSKPSLSPTPIMANNTAENLKNSPSKNFLSKAGFRPTVVPVPRCENHFFQIPLQPSSTKHTHAHARKHPPLNMVAVFHGPNSPSRKIVGAWLFDSTIPRPRPRFTSPLSHLLSPHLLPFIHAHHGQQYGKKS